jgi:hypothetical protein
VADYQKLKTVLDAAYRQSAEGKGKERHANERDFDRQPILEIGRMVGPGYHTGQAMKKCQEAIGMVSRGEHDKAVQELLGTIVYAAAAVVLITELSAAAQKTVVGTRVDGRPVAASRDAFVDITNSLGQIKALG